MSAGQPSSDSWVRLTWRLAHAPTPSTKAILTYARATNFPRLRLEFCRKLHARREIQRAQWVKPVIGISLPRRVSFFQLLGVIVAISGLLGCASTSATRPVPTVTSEIPPNLFKDCSPATSYLPKQTGTSWNDDVSYDLSEKEIKSTSGARKILRIIGDSLVIDQKHFESIIRSTSDPITNFDEITFDARRIVVTQPLTFTSSTVRLLAQEILITSNGSIALVSPPERSTGDGLLIVTQSLEVERGLKKPFLFYTRVADSAGPQRSATIIAVKTVIDHVLLEDSQEDAQHTLLHLSLDFPAPRGAPAHDSLWSVTVGEPAKMQYLDYFRSEMSWPPYFAAKASKWLAQSYDDNSRDALRTELEAALPSLAQWASLAPYATVSEAQSRIIEGLGPDGNARDYVPRVGLQYQIDVLRKRLESEGQYTQALRQLILSALQAHKLDSEQLAEVRKNAETATSNADVIVENMGKAITTAAELDQDIAAQQTLTDQVRATIKLDLEDMKQHQKDAYNIGIATKVVAMAACALPVAAPVALAISTGVSLTGDAVYGHQIGQDATPGSILQSFQSVKDRSAAYQQQLQTTKTAYDQMSKDWGQLKASFSSESPADKKSLDAKRQAAEGMKGSVENLANAGLELYKNLESVPKPTEIQMDTLEAQSGELQAHLAEMTRLRALQGDANAKIEEYRKALGKAQNDYVQQKSLEQELLEGHPRNDADYARWKAAALSLWRSYFANVYQDAVTLRQAYFFETGEFPLVDPDALFYPDETLAYMAQDLYKPEGPTAGLDAVRDNLLREETKLIAAVSGLLDAVDSGERLYLAKRTSRDLVSYSFRMSASGQTLRSRVACSVGARDNTVTAADDPPTLKFLSFINAQICAEVARKFSNEQRDKTKGLPGGAPIYIPVELPVSVSPFPERFINARISALKWDAPAAADGKSFRFVIQHGGYGAMVRNGSCYRYDLRQQGAENRIFRTTTVRGRTVEPGRSEGEAIMMDPLGLRFYTLYPARAPYFLSVEVDGDRSDPSWQWVPLVTEIELQIEIMQ